jgi:hypothetical protein
VAGLLAGIVDLEPSAAASPDFSVSITPAQVALRAGTSTLGSAVITVTALNGLVGQISFALTSQSLPNGVWYNGGGGTYLDAVHGPTSNNIQVFFGAAPSAPVGAGSITFSLAFWGPHPAGTTPPTHPATIGVNVVPANASINLAIATPFQVTSGGSTAPSNDLSPPATGTSAMTVTSVNQFAGSAILSATCCFDELRGGTVSQPDGAVVAVGGGPGTGPANPTATGQVNVSVSGAGSTPLSVTTSGAPTSFGKFLISVVASTPAAVGINKHATVGFMVLPRGETLPACGRFTSAPSPGVTLLKSSEGIKALINAKESTPPVAAVIAIFFKPYPDAVRLVVTDTPTLQLNQTTVAVDNETGSDTSFIPFNGVASCSPGTETVLTSHQTGRVTVNNSAATTLLFRRKVCTFSFLWCVSWSWRDLAVFSEPGFWTIAGGRTLNFTWVHD